MFLTLVDVSSTHTHTHTHTHKHTRTHTYTHAHKHTDTRTYTDKHRQTDTYRHIQTDNYIYICLFLCVHAYTQTCLFVWYRIRVPIGLHHYFNNNKLVCSVYRELWCSVRSVLQEIASQIANSVIKQWRFDWGPRFQRKTGDWRDDPREWQPDRRQDQLRCTYPPHNGITTLIYAHKHTQSNKHTHVQSYPNTQTVHVHAPIHKPKHRFIQKTCRTYIRNDTTVIYTWPTCLGTRKPTSSRKHAHSCKHTQFKQTYKSTHWQVYIATSIWFEIWGSWIRVKEFRFLKSNFRKISIFSQKICDFSIQVDEKFRFFQVNWRIISIFSGKSTKHFDFFQAKISEQPF